MLAGGCGIVGFEGYGLVFFTNEVVKSLRRAGRAVTRFNAED